MNSEYSIYIECNKCGNNWKNTLRMDSSRNDHLVCLPYVSRDSESCERLKNTLDRSQNCHLGPLYCYQQFPQHLHWMIVVFLL